MKSLFGHANKNTIYGFPGSVEVAGEKLDGETPIRRLRMTKDKLTTQPMEGIESSLPSAHRF